MFESIPVESPDDLEAAVRQVWRSLLGGRALSYYSMAGLEAFPRMAVVVQPFIDADRSGVMFTRFPSPRGGDAVLVEHVEGDCEKLVLGEVDPERLWLPRIDSEEGGALDPPAGDVAPLARATARELQRVAMRLENELDSSQDVEWAVRDGEIFVLQSRPITSLPATNHAARSTVEPSGDEIEPLLRGLGASTGRAAGLSRLVFHIHDADELTAGQVLVTRMTNPDMVTAMQRSAAVVTDVGGMICHAAIVSRELGIPCVVGTGDATATVGGGDPLTVDGASGLIFPGLLAGYPSGGEADRGEASPRGATLSWDDLWSGWLLRALPGDVPRVRSIDALPGRPKQVEAVVLDPWIDLALDEGLHAVHLEALDPSTRQRRFADYCRRLASSGSGVRILANLPGEPGEELVGAAREAGIAIAAADEESVPLATVGLDPVGREEGAAASGDPERVFGTAPAVRSSPMPPAKRREAYRELLPRLAEAHRRAAVETVAEYQWIDARPEVVITPLLKSVVLAGMETVPLALGFDELDAMHVQWIGCRFHFRADTFQSVLPRLMKAQWEGRYLDDLLTRTRDSYDRLEVEAERLPESDAELAALSAAGMREVLLPWWRAFVDFFALSFFIQAQGDDGMAPVITSAVADNADLAAALGLSREQSAGVGLELPGIAELTAPTSPVMTAEYMASLFEVKRAMERSQPERTPDTWGDSEADGATEALSTPEVRASIERHLSDWWWMRERDPYFAPYDTAEVVARQAARAQRPSGGPTTQPDYEANALRGRLALAFHLDLVEHRGGDAERLAYAVGYNHRLAMERENHHVVWLRSSYRFRRLVLECERRLAEHAELLPGDVFFFELPELLEAVEALPEPPPSEVLERIHNRRLAYHREARLEDPSGLAGEPGPEPDYI